MRGIINIFVLLLIFIGLLASLYLVRQAQIFKSRAASYSKIELVGPNVSGGKALGRYVKARLTFVPTDNSPSPSLTASPTGTPTPTATTPSQTPNPSPSPTTNPNFRTGVNIPSIADFGYGDMNPIGAKSSDIDDDLRQVKNKGGSIIRIFVANKEVDPSETARRLNNFLDQASQFNISVIISLIDFYGGPWDHQSVITVYNHTACPGQNIPTPDITNSTVVTCKGETKTWDQVERELIGANYASAHAPKGMSEYYSVLWNQTALLNNDFFAGGYRNIYKSFVQTVVTSAKSHSNIYAWEIGNELKNDTSKETFLSFMQDMSSYIKSLDPNHKIASGFISAGHPGFSPQTLYPLLPNIDIITVHTYSGDHSGLGDITWANQNNKEGIIEEIGGTNLSGEINYWKSQGAKAVLPWDLGDYLNLPQNILGVNSTSPTHFKIANSAAGLDSAVANTFDVNPKEIDWTLTPGNGIKTVFAQFLIEGRWSEPIYASIDLEEAIFNSSPSPSSRGLPTPFPSYTSTTASGSGTFAQSLRDSNDIAYPTIQPTPTTAPVSVIQLLQERRFDEIRKIAQATPEPTPTSSDATQNKPPTNLVARIPILGEILNLFINNISKVLNFWKKV